MLKKIILGILFAGLTAVLVIGAINRTAAKSEDGSRAAGRGRGQNHSVQNVGTNQQDKDFSGGGRGNGGGQGNGGRYQSNQEITPGVGQAEVDEWITLQGHVASANENALVVRMSSGELVTVENRPWRFAQEQGFLAAVGDEVALTGFYEGEEFETGQLANITTNLVIEIRQENGRPLWAGGG
jgi:hypothetical protein